MNVAAMIEPQRIRRQIRDGRITGTSRGLAHGYVQCNLAILSKAYAFDFLLYCQRNQRACPVLEVTDPGDPVPRRLAPDGDVRTDCARYAIYRDGVRREDRTDILDLWQRRPRRFPDRLRHQLRWCARARRRPDRQGPLGTAHHHADRAGRSVPRRPDRHHALADGRSRPSSRRSSRRASRSTTARRSTSAIRRRSAPISTRRCSAARCRPCRRA